MMSIKYYRLLFVLLIATSLTKAQINTQLDDQYDIAIKPCSESNPSNDFESGAVIDSDGIQLVAADLFVDANVEFLLNEINAGISVTIGNNLESLDVRVYTNSEFDVPDEIFASIESVVPAEQTLVGSDAFKNYYSVTLDLETPFLLPGGSEGTLYWIEIRSNSDAPTPDIGWEVTTEDINGFPFAFNITGIWIRSTGNEVVYVFNGECTFLGNNEFSFEDQLWVYPNPADDLINIFIESQSAINKNNLEIYVLDINGVKVYTSNKFTHSIDVSGLSSGLYFLNIKSDLGVLTKKIIVD